jgi:hypothetical protein
VSAPEEPIPYIELNLAGDEFQATPLNASLFTFAGRSVLENGMSVENSTYDHVFLRTHQDQETDDDIQKGTYIFQPEIVQQMGEVMIAYGFPCRINQREVQPCDMDAYNTYVEQNATYFGEQMDDFIPEDWSEDGNA